MKHKIAWNMVNAESEWTYFGEGTDVDKNAVTNSINSHFSEPLLCLCSTRQNSFETTKEDVGGAIEELLGSQDFFIWDIKFKRVIEFNAIGVMRKGQVSG